MDVYKYVEILIIVVLAILIIGPKDFPHVLKKVGGWIGSLRSYFSEVQKELTKVENEDFIFRVSRAGS